MAFGLKILRQRSNRCDYKLCIICQQSGGKLISTEYGCNRIRQAANSRRDVVWHRLNTMSVDVLFLYHMSNACYKSYVNKTKVERASNILAEREEAMCINTTPEDFDCEQPPNVEPNHTQNCTRSSVLHLSSPMACLICDNTYHKGIMKTYKITSENRALAILTISRYNNDEIFKRIGQITSTAALTAAGVYCHKDCLRSYERSYERVCKRKVTYDNSAENYNDSIDSTYPDQDYMADVTNVDENYVDQQKKSISTVFEGLKISLQQGEIFTLTNIRDAVNKLLPLHLALTNLDIKRQLMQQLGDDIQFSIPQQANKPTIVYHSSLSIEEVLENMCSQNVLDKCPTILRGAFQSINYNLDDSFCDANDLRQSWMTEIPTPIIHFFAKLLKFDENDFLSSISTFTSDIEETDLSNSSDVSALKICRVKTLIQMIYFVLYGGKKRTPVHVISSLTIHNVCKSASLITSFNRLGMCISYESTQRIKTSLASYTVAANEEKKKVPLPIHFNKAQFTKAAFDNFDHEGRSLSGKEGTHDTVSVLFQRQSQFHETKPSVSETKVDKSSRTFHPELECQQLKAFDKPSGPIKLAADYKVTFDQMSINPMMYRSMQCADDMAWFLSRTDISTPNDIKFMPNDQKVPTWSAFLSILKKDCRPKDIVAFLPVLPHPVTEYRTVYTALHNFKDIASQLDQAHLPVFCDEGVYKIARHIMLEHPDEFAELILMLGTFHTVKVALACVGKYLHGSGIDSVLVESGIFGVNTVDQVLSGNNYARSIKGFCMVEEALVRLQLEEFFKENNIEFYDQELNIISTLQEAIMENNEAEGQCLLETFAYNSVKLLQDFHNFIEHRCTESPLFNYWHTSMILIRLIRDLVRADRTGDWLLHVNTMKKIVPIFHIMDHPNYARWGTIYVQDIILLSETAPEVYQEFMTGSFVVKLSDVSNASVPTDQSLEMTINRSQKCPHGIIGATRQSHYVARWEITYHEMLAISNLLKDITNLKNDNYELRVHHDISPIKIQKSEEFVQAIIKYITLRVNPFKGEVEPVRNIINSELPLSKSIEDLLNIFEKGCSKYAEFLTERLCTRAKSISDVIHGSKLEGFKPKKLNAIKQNEKKIVSDDREYRLFIDLASNRNCSIQTLFEYELTTVNSLFESPRVLKRDKNLTLLLDELVSQSRIHYAYNTSPQLKNSCIIVNILQHVHSIRWKNLKTFNALAVAFYKSIKTITEGEVSRIDFMFDPGPNTSDTQDDLHSYSREAIPIYSIDRNTPLPIQEKSFWAHPNNVILFQNFVRAHILTEACQIWPDAEFICSATSQNSCISTIENRCTSTLQLSNDFTKEDIDLHIMRHIESIVNENYKQICMLSVATETIVIGLYHWARFRETGLQELWAKPHSVKAIKNMLPLHAMANFFGDEFCQVLPAAHYLTGSVITSKLGTKKSAIRVNPAEYLTSFAKSVTSKDIEQSVQSAEQYLISVLRKSNPSQTFDELRYWTYRFTKPCPVHELPPTSKSLRLHILRAFYEVYNQTSCFSEHEILDPLHFGYDYVEGNIVSATALSIYPPTSDLPPACNCSKCKNLTCGCVAAQLPCIPFCSCQSKGTCINHNNN